MARSRFMTLLRFLRFDDAIARHQNPQAFPRIQPIHVIFEVLVKQCREVYQPAEFVCVDEMLIRFRGRCFFRVYMKSKPGSGYGLKVWALVDVDTGYVCNLQVSRLENMRGYSVINVYPTVLDLSRQARSKRKGTREEGCYGYGYPLCKPRKRSYC